MTKEKFTKLQELNDYIFRLENLLNEKNLYLCSLRSNNLPYFPIALSQQSSIGKKILDVMKAELEEAKQEFESM